MTDLVFRFGVTKLVVSLVLAAVAVLVQRRSDRPSISHMVWLLLLAALLVPSVVPLALPSIGGAEVTSGLAVAGGAAPAGPAVPAELLTGLKAALVILWFTGSACVLVWTTGRAFRFDRLLRAAATPAPPALGRLGAEIGAMLGLERVPPVLVTRARLSPMVWWTGGQVRLLIPEALLSRMDAGELRGVLAHELAHVRRGDHITRWLEWLVCVGFWWNPVVWWARRELRASEEFCCDALVLSRLDASPRSYGGSLLSVIDYLSTPAAVRPPAFASAAYSGGRTTLIERRLRKIMGTQRDLTPRWFRVTFAAGLAAALSLGLVYCGGDTAVVAPMAEEGTPSQPEASAARGPDETLTGRELAVREAARKLEKAVADGEITSEQAREQLDRLKASLGTSTVVKRVPASEGETDKAAQAEIELRQVTEKIRAELQSGQMTAEQAEVQLREVRLKADYRDELQVREKAEVGLQQLSEKLRAAVESGELTEEEARARLSEIRRRQPSR